MSELFTPALSKEEMLALIQALYKEQPSEGRNKLLQYLRDVLAGR